MFDQYLVRLREQAQKCKFDNHEDREIVYQISQTARVMRVKEKAYEAEMTIQKLIDYAHIQEIVEDRKERERSDHEAVVGNIQSNLWFKRDRNEMAKQSISSKRLCNRCGSKYHYANDTRCPARQMKCNKCKSIGHFARMCRSKLNIHKQANSIRKSDEVKQVDEKNKCQDVVKYIQSYSDDEV